MKCDTCKSTCAKGMVDCPFYEHDLVKDTLKQMKDVVGHTYYYSSLPSSCATTTTTTSGRVRYARL